MFTRARLILAALLLASTAWADTGPAVVLRAYGPGGPHHVLQDAAALYKEKCGVTVIVDKAGPVQLAKKLKEDGDIFFTGAEFMLEEFTAEHPDLLDPATINKLHPRRVGIIVRKGNPLKIESVNSLLEEGVDLMAAHLERMDPFLTASEDGRKSIEKLVFTGSEGVTAWRNSRELDAWITYKSWHVALEGESEFIEIPCDHALRNTMVAVTNRTSKREEARKFVEFLKGEEARRLFLEHGWE